MTRATIICQCAAGILFSITFAASSSFAQSQDARFEVSADRLAVAEGDAKGATLLPCAPQTWAGDETRFYGACPSGGLLVVDVTNATKPKPLEVIAFDSAVTRVFRIQGDIWFELSNGAARPLLALDGPEPAASSDTDDAVVEADEQDDETSDEADEVDESELSEDPDKPEESPSMESKKPAAEEFAPIRGEIIEVTPSHVVVDIGAQAGIEKDDRFLLLVEEVQKVGNDDVKQERELGVGRVTTVSANRSKVELPLNAVIPDGAYARTTRQPPTRHRYAPPIVRGVSNLNVNVRPFLALGTLGGGAVIDAGYTYRFDAPIAVDLKLTPFAFGIAQDGNILTFAGNAFLSYDTRLFQVGLGAGISQVNEGRASFVPASEGRPDSTSLGFSAAQFIRLGAPDGLNVEIVNNFVLVDDEFEFGGIDIKGTFPTSTVLDNTWLIVRGGGGVPGYVYGEVGMRVLGIGNGGPGSVFFLPTVGFVTLEQEEYESCQEFVGPSGQEDGFCARTSTAYGGPMVGFGAEWRF